MGQKVINIVTIHDPWISTCNKVMEENTSHPFDVTLGVFKKFKEIRGHFLSPPQPRLKENQGNDFT